MNTNSRIEAFHRAEHAYLSSIGVESRERFVTLERLGITGRLRECGEGPPVLMLHGGGGVGTEWAPFMTRLDSFRLIAADRPGFGLTDFVDYRNVDLKAHAIQFLDDVLDAAEVESVSVIANSMGALWSLWFARARPNRIDRMALIGTPALIVGTSAPPPMRLLGIPGLNRFLMGLDSPSTKQTHRLLKMLGHDPDRVAEDLMVEMMVRLQQLPDYTAAWCSLLENVLRFGRVNPRVRLGASDLAQITHEILYVWGQRDPFGSIEAARRTRDASPHAKLVPLGDGHLPWLDEPDACAAAVGEFLKRGLGAEDA